MKKRALIFLLFLWVFILSSTPWAVLSGETLSQLRIYNNTSISTVQIENVFGLKEGQVVTDEEMEEALSKLRKWGQFENVTLEKKNTTQGLELVLSLRESLLITNIHIKGQFPFLTNRIQQVLGIRVGQIFNRDQVLDEVKKIRSFFEREGYFATHVQVKEKIDEKAGKARLTFVIRKGHRLRWRDIKIEGATVFPRGFLVSKINPWFPYQPKRLRRSLENIKKSYKDKGYPRAQVKIEHLYRDFAQKKADLTIRIIEREHLNLFFEGNVRLSDKTLKGATTFFDEEGVDEFEVEESQKALLKLYHSKGFSEVSIHSEFKRQTHDKVTVRFIIDEGPSTQVKKIDIIGNQKMKDRKIKAVLITKKNGPFQSGAYSPHNLEKDKNFMTQYYRRQGFPEMEVNKTDAQINRWHDQASLIFDIFEGPRFFIGDILFDGNDYFKKKKLEKISQLKKGQPLNRDLIDTALEKLKIAYAKNGFPYVTVEVDFRTNEQYEVDVLFNIQQGVLVRVGELLIVGNDKTKNKSILKVMALHTGDVFSYEKVLKSTTNLRKLGSLRSVNIETIGLTEKKSIVHLLIHVEEQAPYIVDFKGSYDTDDKFSGSIVLTNSNLLGHAKRANFKLTAGSDLLRAESNYIDAHLLGSDLEFILTAFAQQEQRASFDANDLGGSISLLYEITSRLNFLFKYEVVRTIFLRGTPDQDEGTEDRTLPRVGISLGYDTRDYFADPKHGIFVLGSIDMFHRFINIGQNFLHLSNQFLDYRTIKIFTFANSLRIDNLFELGEDVAIPRRKLLFIGGDYSVRGFEEDKAGLLNSDVPVGGEFRWIYNFEIQFQMAEKFKLATFFDTGSLTQGIQDMSLDSVRHSAGLGLRYITPVGPLRFDYGFKLDKKSDESIGRLHFTFGFAF
ncbi:MAG: outer membrane protein assembly factor BamA [Deltaproteobacteria bacterium GWA2_50_8]|nr:MAG: outer membrane protein assembly factor BamA [Deltaproteobacteria bacterium GWA2_50_8]